MNMKIKCISEQEYNRLIYTIASLQEQLKKKNNFEEQESKTIEELKKEKYKLTTEKNNLEWKIRQLELKLNNQMADKLPVVNWHKCYMDVDDFFETMREECYCNNFLVVEELKSNHETRFHYCMNYYSAEYNGMNVIEMDTHEGEEHYKVVAYIREDEAHEILIDYFRKLTRKQIEEV